VPSKKILSGLKPGLDSLTCTGTFHGGKVTRRAWLEAVKHDPQDRIRREQSDFLSQVDHEGAVFDFHALRHTCGSWLAMAGEHPKVVQTVMRHSSIVLTMDTYGHLFPGQEADAVGRLRDMLAHPPNKLRATGTDDVPIDAPEPAQRQAQQLAHEMIPSRATACDGGSARSEYDTSPNLLQVTGLCDAMRGSATAEGTGLYRADFRMSLATSNLRV
jgi:hypothetical protein